jgi:hypothetical protein
VGAKTRTVYGEEQKGAALAGPLSSCAGRAGGAYAGVNGHGIQYHSQLK